MRSISSRFIAIFVMLVLVTTLIFGALFVRFFYKYDIELISSRVDRLSELIMPKLKEYEDVNNFKSEFISYLDLHSQLGSREQFFVLSKNKIIATSSNTSGRADSVLDSDLLIMAESGESLSKICIFDSGSEKFRTYDKAFPINKDNKHLGVLYIKYSLEDLDQSSMRSIRIIIQSLVISLGFSLVLAIFIAGSVTRPINKLTQRASTIATGNFTEQVDIKSNDEIGELAKMFNHMAQKLSISLDETYREKNKMEAIVNNIVDGIIAVDSKGYILHINPSANIMLSQLNIIDFSNYKKLSESLPKTLAFECIMNLNDSSEFRQNIISGLDYYEVRCEHFYDERGEITGFILLFQDVTKEAKLENMRRDFIANVSHELKTPITIIKSYSETMLEQAEIDSETRKSFMRVINDEAYRMGILVNDLLQLSSIDAGKVELIFGRYSWNEFLKSISDRYKVQFEADNIDFQFIENEKNLIGEFDYDRMEQVINNLIGNAIKYSENGGKIKLILDRDDENAIIKVIDTGIGISNENIDKLFSRFYRVEKSRQRKAGGSGLGLSIVKHLLDLHGAKISVRSQLGEGSEFTIRISLINSDASEFIDEIEL